MKVEMLNAYMDEVEAKRNTIAAELSHYTECGKWEVNHPSIDKHKEKLQFYNELLMYLYLHPNYTPTTNQP